MLTLFDVNEGEEYFDFSEWLCASVMISVCPVMWRKAKCFGFTVLRQVNVIFFSQCFEMFSLCDDSFFWAWSTLQGPLKKKWMGLAIGHWHSSYQIWRSSKQKQKNKLETVIAQSSNLVWLFIDKVDEVRMTNALQNYSSRNICQEQLFVWGKLHITWFSSLLFMAARTAYRICLLAKCD